jgi:hypothetical protein
MGWCGSPLGLVSVHGNLTLQSRLRMFSGLIRRMDGAAHLILLRRISQLPAFAAAVATSAEKAAAESFMNNAG